VIAAALISVSAAFAQEQAKSHFDLPADSAEISLRRFSVQSGLSIMFPTETTRGIRTQAVQGAFTPREALDRMLAGTPLRVLQDKKSGALTIVRSPVAGQQSESSTLTPASEESAASKKKLT